MRVENPASRDPSMVKIVLLGNGIKAARTVESLIDASQEMEAPYLFAGRHAGMPLQWVWALTRNRESIEPYIDTIVDQVKRTAQSLDNPKNRPFNPFHP